MAHGSRCRSAQADKAKASALRIRAIVQVKPAKVETMSEWVDQIFQAGRNMTQTSAGVTFAESSPFTDLIQDEAASAALSKITECIKQDSTLYTTALNQLKSLASQLETRIYERQELIQDPEAKQNRRRRSCDSKDPSEAYPDIASMVSEASERSKRPSVELERDSDTSTLNVHRTRSLDDKGVKPHTRGLSESGIIRSPSQTWLAEPDSDAWTTIEKLKGGFKSFKTEVYHNFPQLFHSLQNCQSPKVMMITCCDSRVSPNMILQAHPGDVFTVRNVANLVPPYERQGDYHGTSAALEYAVCFLKVEQIIIMGHSNCGGIRALMTKDEAELKAGVNKTDFIDTWMRLGLPARERTHRYASHLSPEDQLCYCEKESVNVSLANLLSFPWVKEAVNQGNLSIHGWYYNMTACSLSTWTMRLHVSEYEIWD
ncbi:hypothetical protein CYMTET_21335 [Cymbomonas tetramitiformis]|uniref:carbonic anhydrase n=1 Tax=Cymbomonas tetramitiformis TaxID=36881 RepID=A0AAE0L3B4_9CHLO|nr:hypothetical protein CYMTET_21335 [Cymbomonas tetramitiformis]